MSTQPEALLIADQLERRWSGWVASDETRAADELRRLHALNAQMLDALRKSRLALGIANEQPFGPISDTIWMPYGKAQTLFDFMDAAIAAGEQQ